MNDGIYNKISVRISCVFTLFFKIFKGQKDWQTRANPRGAFAPKIIIFGSWGLYIRVHKKNCYHQEWSVDEHDQLWQGEGRWCWWKWRHTYKPFHGRDCRNMQAKIKRNDVSRDY